MKKRQFKTFNFYSTPSDKNHCSGTDSSGKKFQNKSRGFKENINPNEYPPNKNFNFKFQSKNKVEKNDFVTPLKAYEQNRQSKNNFRASNYPSSINQKNDILPKYMETKKFDENSKNKEYAYECNNYLSSGHRKKDAKLFINKNGSPCDDQIIKRRPFVLHVGKRGRIYHKHLLRKKFLKYSGRKRNHLQNYIYNDRINGVYLIKSNNAFSAKKKSNHKNSNSKDIKGDNTSQKIGGKIFGSKKKNYRRFCLLRHSNKKPGIINLEKKKSGVFKNNKFGKENRSVTKKIDFKDTKPNLIPNNEYFITEKFTRKTEILAQNNNLIFQFECFECDRKRKYHYDCNKLQFQCKKCEKLCSLEGIYGYSKKFLAKFKCSNRMIFTYKNIFLQPPQCDNCESNFVCKSMKFKELEVRIKKNTLKMCSKCNLIMEIKDKKIYQSKNGFTCSYSNTMITQNSCLRCDSLDLLLIKKYFSFQTFFNDQLIINEYWKATKTKQSLISTDKDNSNEEIQIDSNNNSLYEYKFDYMLNVVEKKKKDNNNNKFTKTNIESSRTTDHQESLLSKQLQASNLQNLIFLENSNIIKEKISENFDTVSVISSSIEKMLIFENPEKGICNISRTESLSKHQKSDFNNPFNFSQVKLNKEPFIQPANFQSNNLIPSSNKEETNNYKKYFIKNNIQINNFKDQRNQGNQVKKRYNNFDNM